MSDSHAFYFSIVMDCRVFFHPAFSRESDPMNDETFPIAPVRAVGDMTDEAEFLIHSITNHYIYIDT